ncbi:MAG: hypothetical protein K9I95_00730 [Flavobacteriaceae bacterium]|nr:hypothetical protein [Flavobacteriaceae bacterium]
MKKYIIKIALVLSAAILTIACNEDDATGAATVTAKSPSLSVTLDFANSQTLVEQEATYAFTVTLSEPQIADVRVYLEQISGTATNGDDFSMPANITIPAGKTTASDVILLHADDLIEDTETATIKIGTGLESNVGGISSQTITFNIANLTEGDLAIGLEWETAETITDNYGNEIGAYAAADLRLLLTDVPYTTLLDGADGGSAEHYVLDGAAPDGEYYIVADFYDATDIPVDLNLTLSFDQVGVINGQTHSFAAALNTTDICADLYFILAKVTKTGDTYSFQEVGTKSTIDLSNFAGTWSGPATWYEYFGYTSEVVTTIDSNGDLWVNGIAFQWFEGWWGEVIVTNTPVKVTLTDPCTGSFVISEQPYLTSTYNDAPQPAYGLSGYGTIIDDNGTIKMIVYPTFHQSGGTFNGPEFGGIPFKEVLTLD